MKQLVITKDSANRRVSHSGTSKKLGEYSQDELVKLAITAINSGNKLLLSAFESLPTLEELTGTKVDAAIKEVAAKPALTATTSTTTAATNTASNTPAATQVPETDITKK